MIMGVTLTLMFGAVGPACWNIMTSGWLSVPSDRRAETKTLMTGCLNLLSFRQTVVTKLSACAEGAIIGNCGIVCSY